MADVRAAGLPASSYLTASVIIVRSGDLFAIIYRVIPATVVRRFGTRC